MLVWLGGDPKNRFALGTREISIARKSFKVCIRYREPEYERRTRPRAEPFRFTFAVEGVNEAEAERLAVAQFEQVAKESSVNWDREIVGIEVTLADVAD